MPLRPIALALALLLGVGAGGYALATSEDAYQVSVVLPTATNLVRGGEVQVRGFKVGEISELDARDGQAVVTVEVDDDHAPLHAGTAATIEWRALLGERILRLEPGPAGNPAIPDGGLVEGRLDRVEIDQVLAALDGPTRARLRALLGELDGTVAGNESDLSRTLRTVGPSIRALGQVLEQVGRDGPAIRAVVARMNRMTGELAARRTQVEGVVVELSRMLSETAAEQQALQQGLRELPTTLQVAQGALNEVPAATDAAVPLLQDLAPATRRLPSVARNLRPVLTDLRPTIAEMRPTLYAAQGLLRDTPALLDSAHGTLPPLNRAVVWSQPALAFLRPYTPELAGWLANWGSAMANYDSNGHYARIFFQGSAASWNANPGAMPPGIEKNPHRQPGELEGQPWTDAHGSTMR